MLLVIPALVRQEFLVEVEVIAAKMSCELKLFLPRLTAPEGNAALRVDSETTLLQLHLK